MAAATARAAVRQRRVGDLSQQRLVATTSHHDGTA